ncbi:MAG: YtxH domain-containing protein [Lewinellaceae bacterium]|nr:YtxH domain-containing protein [Saprospiraceae bacterium]MCB9332038.1 YtxH domain-containing protein [Lewinellaceae bacterium]
MKNDAIPRSLFFLAGAASGLALGYYLHTEKGRALREHLNENWEDWLETIGEQAQEQLHVLLQNLNQVLEDSALFSVVADEDEADDDNDFADEIMEQFEVAESAFEVGMTKARASLKQKLAQAGLAMD